MNKPVNFRIKQALKNHSIPIWKLADMCGTSETTMFRRLRHELPEKEQTRIIKMIEEISKERNGS